MYEVKIMTINEKNIQKLNLEDIIQPVTNKITSIFQPELRYTFLVGAGISMNPPSNLPSAQKIVQVLLELTLPPKELKNFDIYSLRYELIVQHIQEYIDPNLTFLDYFELVKSPNIIHFLLAELIKKGNCVVTTNFDNLIEYALISVLQPNLRSKITPVITRNDFLNYQDPKLSLYEGKYPLYKIHGAKRNVVTGQPTSDSLVTTMRSLSRDRIGVETFAIEPYKKPAMQNLMKGRTLVVMGYSGNDDFDIRPILKELPFIDKLIWIEHAKQAQPSLFKINRHPQFMNIQYQKKIDYLLAEIRSDTFFDIYKIEVNTTEFIKNSLWDVFLPEVIIPSINEKIREKPLFFRKWVKPLFSKLGKLIQYRLAADLYSDLGDHENERRVLKLCLKIAKKNKDELNEAIIISLLGKIESHLGNLKQASKYYEQAFDITKKNNSLNPGHYISLAVIKLQLGNMTEAKSLLEQALAQEHNEDGTKASILHNLAYIEERYGNFDVAIEFINSSLNIVEKIGGFLLKFHLISLLSAIKGSQNQYELSHKYATEAYNLSEQLGNPVLQIHAEYNYGNTFMSLGDFSKAEEHLTRALQLSEHLNEKRILPELLNALGLLLSKQGQNEKAYQKYKEAYELSSKLSNIRAKITSLNNLALSQSKQNNPELQIKYFEEALCLAKENNIIYMIDTIQQNIKVFKWISSNDRKEAQLFNDEAINYMNRNDFDSAFAKISKAYELSKNSGETHFILTLLNNLGHIQIKKGDFDKATLYFKEALQIAQKNHNYQKMGDMLYSIGKTYIQAKKFDQGLSFLKKSIDNAKNRGDTEKVVELLNDMSAIYLQMGDLITALKTKDEADEIEKKIGKSNSLTEAKIKKFNGFLRDPDKYIHNLLKLGVNLAKTSQWDEASKKFEQALKLSNIHKITRWNSQIWANLGSTYLQKKDFQQARKYLEKNLPILRNIQETNKTNSNQMTYGIGLVNTAACYQALELDELAIPLIKEAIALFDEIHESNYNNMAKEYLRRSQLKIQDNLLKTSEKEIERLLEIAYTYSNQKNYNQALNYYNKALPLAENSNDSSNLLNVYYNLGNIYYNMKETVSAIKNTNKGLKLAKEINEKVYQGKFYDLLAKIYEFSGQLEEASTNFKLAIESFNKCAEKTQKMRSLINLARLLKKNEKFEKALKCVDNLYEEITEEEITEEEIFQKSDILQLEASIKDDQCEFETVYELYQQLYEIYQNNNDKENMESVVKTMKLIKKKVADPQNYASEQFQIAMTHLALKDPKKSITNLKHISRIYTKLGDTIKSTEIQEKLNHIEQIATNIQTKSQKIQEMRKEYKQLISEENYPKALKIQFNVLRIAKEILNLNEITMVSSDIGTSYYLQHDSQNAIKYYFNALKSVRILKNPFSEALILRYLTTTYVQAGDYKKALEHRNQAIKIFKTLNDQNSITELMNSVPDTQNDISPQTSQTQQSQKLLLEGIQVLQQGKCDLAIEKFTLAYQQAEIEENPSTELKALINIGSCYSRIKDHEKAISFFERGLKLAEKLNDMKNKSILMVNAWQSYYEFGPVKRANKFLVATLEHLETQKEYNFKELVLTHSGNYFFTCDPERAIKHFTEALVIAKELKNNREIAINTGKLGTLYKFQNNFEKGKELLSKAIEMAEKSKIPECLSEFTATLGDIYEESENYDLSIENFEKSLAAFTQMKTKREAAIIANRLGILYLKINNKQKAQKRFNESLSIYQELGEEDKIIDIKSRLKELNVEMESNELKINELIENATKKMQDKKYNKSLTILKQLLNQNSENLTLSRKISIMVKIGINYYSLGDLQAAIQQFKNSLKIAIDNGDYSMIKTIYLNLGLINKDLKNYDEALKNFEESLKFTNQLDKKQNQALIYRNLGHIYQLQSDYIKAVDNYEKSLALFHDLDLKTKDVLFVLSQLALSYVKTKNLEKALSLDDELTNIAIVIGMENSPLLLQTKMMFDKIKGYLENLKNSDIMDEMRQDMERLKKLTKQKQLKDNHEGSS